MEAITLVNFKKNSAAALVKKAEKLVVRDVDEEQANVFVAYVDQNGTSYDVAIEVSAEKEIISSRCDCTGSGFCMHRIALADYLVKTRVKKESAAKKKKKVQSEELIAQLDEVTLKNWLVQLLQKNKDLELLFVSEFSAVQTQYGKAEVKLLISSTIKSVINSKKKVELNELKKIVDLLEVTLKPVLLYCENNLSQAEALEIVLLICEELIRFHNRIDSHSVRVIEFVKELLHDRNTVISSIEEEGRWRAVVDVHFKVVFFDVSQSIPRVVFSYLVSLYHSATTERKRYYAEKLSEFFLHLYKNAVGLNAVLATFMLDVFKENHLFEDLFVYFKPLGYENDFNLALIDSLLAINQMALAQKIAEEQVSANSYVEYNVPYWKRLKEIYRDQGDNEKLVAIAMETVSMEYDFEDYLKIQDAIPESEFKKFRSNLLGKAKKNFDKSNEAVGLYFKILFAEKSFVKMIDLISYQTGYAVVDEYKEQLYLTDKMRLLDRLAAVESHWSYYKKGNENLEYREKILDWVLIRYEAQVLTAFLQSKQRYGPTIFYEEMMKKSNG